MRNAAITLHDRKGRKYLNAAERGRFIHAADQLIDVDRLFCLMVVWTGCRVSEGLSVSAASFDLDQALVAIVTLKRRKLGIVREIPLPPALLAALERRFALRSRQADPEFAVEPLWRMHRVTAWRMVKKVMVTAGVPSTAAMPKGLRHGFGVAAFQVAPPHLVQRWMGHASLKTTALYGDVMGPEERAFAERLWDKA